MKSLRGRLLVNVAAGTGLLLLLFGATLYTVIRGALVREFDGRLHAAAQVMAASIEVEEGDVQIEFDPAGTPQLRGAGPPFLFHLRLAEGRTLFRSGELGPSGLLPFGKASEDIAYKDLRLDGQGKVRALRVRFTPVAEPEFVLTPEGLQESGRAAPEMTLVVARSAEELDAKLADLQLLLVVAWVLTMAVGLATVLSTVDSGLRPVRNLAARIGAIRADELSVRLPTRPMPSEMVPVGEKLNDLLGRLEILVKRERGFTADVAHELRTPLAGLRTTTEIALNRRRRPEEYVEALHDVLQVSRRMETLVERLLTLARLDAGQVPTTTETIPLARLVNTCWESVSESARDRGIRFDNRIVPDLALRANREAVARVLSNLLENAAKYTDDHGRIWTSARDANGVIELTVANTGCSLTPEEASHVFERFWRGDAARADAGLHCGLGLALVGRTMDAMGGTCRAEVREGDVFAVVLTFPATRPEDEPCGTDS